MPEEELQKKIEELRLFGEELQRQIEELKAKKPELPVSEAKTYEDIPIDGQRIIKDLEVINVKNAIDKSAYGLLTETQKTDLTDGGTTTLHAHGSIVSFIPDPPYPQYGGDVVNYTNNTVLQLTRFFLPFKMTINKVTLVVSLVTTAGTIKVCFYSEDGQTKYGETTSSTISAAGVLTITLSSSVTLNPGNYYFGVIPVGTTNIQCRSYNMGDVEDDILTISGKPVPCGVITGQTGGTLPATINPTAIAAGDDKAVLFRLDN